MKPLLITTSLSILVSALVDKNRTREGLKMGLTLFFDIIPPVLVVLIIVSIALHLVSRELIARTMGSGSGIMGFSLAALVGSISLIPAVIAYPLAGSLIKSGVSYSMIAVFITTLTMVGVITMPVEAKYFGIKAALLRNALSLIGAILIGAAISLLWNII